jgi:hypothetical protein
LIFGIAKFHHDVVDLAGKGGMLNERGDKFMLGQAPMYFAQCHEWKAIKDLDDSFYCFGWPRFSRAWLSHNV